MENIVITDGLLKVLEENFGPTTSIRNAKSPNDLYRLQGQLKVLDWLKDKQDELRQAQFEGTETIKIDSS
jgi:hypothetical protein